MADGTEARLAAPQIVQSEAQRAAIIHLTIPRRDMPAMFGPAVSELLTALAAQGVEPVGAVFAHHLSMTPDVFDFELGIKVSSAVAAAGRVKPGELPARKVARTIYTGPYDGLPSAWDGFNAWIKENGHEPDEGLWELYSVGPQSTPDPAQWQTELNRPLVK